MWLYLIAIVLIAVGVVGGILTGGIFTIVLLPLGVVVLIVAVASGLTGRLGAQRRRPSDPDSPLPHSAPSSPGVATSPERLVDARRAEQ